MFNALMTSDHIIFQTSFVLHLPFNRYTVLTLRSTPQTLSDSAVLIFTDTSDTFCNIQTLKSYIPSLAVLLYFIL